MGNKKARAPTCGELTKRIVTAGYARNLRRRALGEEPNHREKRLADAVDYKIHAELLNGAKSCVVDVRLFTHNEVWAVSDALQENGYRTVFGTDVLCVRWL